MNNRGDRQYTSVTATFMKMSYQMYLKPFCYLQNKYFPFAPNAIHTVLPVLSLLCQHRWMTSDWLLLQDSMVVLQVDAAHSSVLAF